jgi:hypothetical protein
MASRYTTSMFSCDIAYAASPTALVATTSPARQPGARPPAGGQIESTAMLLRAITQAITAFEFHILPARSSSPAPYGGWNLCDDVKHTLRTGFVSAQSHRAVHSLSDIWNVPVSPDADLIPEDPKSPGQTASNCAFGHDATLVAAEVRDRRLLDDEGFAMFRLVDWAPPRGARPRGPPRV